MTIALAERNALQKRVVDIVTAVLADRGVQAGRLDDSITASETSGHPRQWSFTLVSFPRFTLFVETSMEHGLTASDVAAIIICDLLGSLRTTQEMKVAGMGAIAS